jgi:hypothetical protein
VDYLAGKENIRRLLLSERGISCDILRTSVIVFPDGMGISGISITQWIETDKGHYFITTRSLAPYDMYTNEKTSEYSVYTHEEYYERFRVKEGVLVIDGQDVTSDIGIRLEGYEIRFPFRAVMERLGVTVTWKGEENEILLTRGAEEFTFSLDDAAVYENGVDISSNSSDWQMMLITWENMVVS